jgi:hypothetical protein
MAGVTDDRCNKPGKSYDFQSQTQGRLLYVPVPSMHEGDEGEVDTPRLRVDISHYSTVSPTRLSCMLTFDDAQSSYMPKGERHLLEQLMSQSMSPRPLIDQLCLRVSDRKASSRRL